MKMEVQIRAALLFSCLMFSVILLKVTLGNLGHFMGACFPEATHNFIKP